MPKKTQKNPHGLTGKQKLVVDDMVAKAKAGKSITPVDSTKKIYNTSTHGSAKTITSRNMNNEDFRSALIDGWTAKRIVGANSKVELRTEEGLDATDKDGAVDYTNRLKYIQEINKVLGVYAPDRKETKTLHLKMDLTEKELDEKINALKDELEDR